MSHTFNHLSSYKGKKDVYFPYPVGSMILSSIEETRAMYQNLTRYLRHKEIPIPHALFNLWCRGSSGAIIAALLSKHLYEDGAGVRICHVKKPGETSHSGQPHPDVSSIHDITLQVIVDDFIATGDTVVQIIDKMRPYSPDIILVGKNPSVDAMCRIDAELYQECVIVN